MNLGTIAVLGSIIAGLVSIPAVSASITGDITAAGAELSGVSEKDFEEVPRTVFEEITSDSMRKTVETAFGRITFNATPEGFSSALQNPRHSLRVERGAGYEETEFVTDSIEIRLKRTPVRVDEICLTAQGTMEKVRKDGGNTVRFSGTGRETVKEDCESARSIMENELQKMRGVSIDLGLALPDIVISRINASEEAVIIRNNGGSAVNLSGWELSDEGGSTFPVEGVVIAPGGTVKVYSEQDIDIDDCAESDGPDYERCWDSSFVWNDGGETATLTNSRGETVDSHTYG